MDKNQVEVGKSYHCSNDLLNKAFSGIVIAKYENSCVIEISHCDTQDKQQALEFNNRFVVSFKRLTE